ncbi:MAG: FecR family protein [Spirochaetota bacterium]
MKKVLAVMLMCTIALIGCKKEKKYTVAREGLVNFVAGTVFLVANGAESKAQIGDAIKEGMTIKTVGPKSMLEIYFGENAVKILGDTVIKVEKLLTNVDSNTEESSFIVEKGRMFSKVTKKLAKGDSYQVKTPTAIAAVRGTDFLVTQEEDKSNVACLDGMLEVLNQSLATGQPIVLEEKQEVDVVPGQNMVAKQISEDKLRILGILLEIKAMREDIRKKYEQQKEEILKYVEDQKAANKTMLDEQREKDKALVEEQKARDKAMIEGIKGEIKDESGKAAQQSLDAAKSQMQDAKAVDKDQASTEAKDQMSAMKPKIEKQKVDLNQFKSQQ